MQVPHHLSYDNGLLRVLLAEIGAVRLYDVKKDGHDRCDALEMERPRGPAELVRDLVLDFYPCPRVRRVNLFRRRTKEHVRSCTLCQRAVALDVAGVLFIVLPRPELRGVYEHAHDDEVVLLLRAADEREMPLMQAAHRRHEPDDAVAVL